LPEKTLLRWKLQRSLDRLEARLLTQGGHRIICPESIRLGSRDRKALSSQSSALAPTPNSAYISV
jgi:hypothetical protein